MLLKNLIRVGVGLVLVAGLALPPAAQASTRASALRAPAHASVQSQFEALLGFLAGLFSGGVMNPDGGGS
jgi:hypothetical protein